MKFKNGDRVTLLHDIVDTEFDYELHKGVEGSVSTFIEIPSQPESNMVIFHPDGEMRLYGISAYSVEKI